MTDNFQCPVKLTADIIGGKWKPLILFYLEGETRRFSALQRLIPGMTKKMLTQHLRELSATRSSGARCTPKSLPGWNTHLPSTEKALSRFSS